MSHPSWKKTLFFLSTAQFLSMIGMSFFLPFIPLYLKELGLKGEAELSTWSGLMFSAGFLMLSLVAPFWGALADRYGRKIMVLRAMGAASIILLLTAFVQNHYQLLFLRLLHGCFSGFVSSAIALIASEAPERSMGFGMGVYQSAITSGFILGPALGGVLQDSFGIRPTIMGGALLVFLGALVVWLGVHEKKKPEPGIKRYTMWENAGFVFRNKTLWPAARIQFLSNMALMSVIPLLALFVEMLRGSETVGLGTMAGLVISSSALSMMVGAPFWGRMADRIGQKKVLTICLCAAGAAFIPQTLAPNIPGLFLARFFLGFFVAGIAPSLQVLIASHTEQDRRAGVLGIGFSLALMGNALGPLLGGTLAGTFGLRPPFALTGIILLIAAAMSSRLKIRLAKAPASPLSQSD